MTSIPADGDIMLRHEDVNSGDVYAFTLYEQDPIKDFREQQQLGKNLAIQFENSFEGDTPQMSKIFYFKIMLAEQSTDDGEGREKIKDRDKLLEYLQQGDNIEIITIDSAYGGLLAEGHIMTFTEYNKIILASIRLEAVGYNVLPANPENFLASIWVDEDNPGSTFGTWQDEDGSTLGGYWR